MEIDLNCDVGEGFPLDAVLMPMITSANIACGGHAGDLTVSLMTLERARENRLQVGAHPGFLDREHFGRREIDCTPQRVYLECQTQITALVHLALIAGVKLKYVKPHGGLYNMACREVDIARPVVHAVEEHGLALMGLPGSMLARVSRGRIPFIAEGFADRRYQHDGSLVPRDHPNAFVTTVEEAVHQARWLIETVGVQTLCVHGDNPEAVAFVAGLRKALVESGVTIRPFEIV
ncbi:MAG: 5-oxoprolinase subunit PxpA [Gemmataceae bacterium]